MPPFENPFPLEPLTRREREILVYLEKNLTNREIAEALTLAESSVKGYTQQIYSKLGVNGRREAVHRARELGILDSPTSVAPLKTHFPTGTVTFLFTDIEGSTSLWESHPEHMAEALQIHNTALRQAIEAHGGVVFKIVGDAFQAAFATAPQALKAAIAAQRALQAATWNEIGPLKARMGLHTGEAELDPGGDEYAVSHTKNRAARIMSAAHGGQILLSAETAELCNHQLPAGVDLKDLGEHSLKGMAHLEHLFQVLAAGLQEEFPPLATQTRPMHNLPRQLTRLIGRRAEIAEVKALLNASPLVTLTGSGGVGETAYRVPSLPTPDPQQAGSLEAVQDSEAVKLFVERARSVLPSFHITAQNTATIAQICQRLDGIPLAIELAAARLNMLTTEQLASRLDQAFRLLTGGARTALPRQQTLRAAIDWSYQLLMEPERVLLRRLAVFAGGCLLEAVEEVCSGDGLVHHLAQLIHLQADHLAG